MNLRPDIRQGRALLITQAIDAAPTAGRLLLFAAPRPAAGQANAALPLAVLPFAQPCATVDDGVTRFSPFPNNLVGQATGQAAWARIEDGNGRWVADLSVTGMAGDGEIRMTTTYVVRGSPLTVLLAQLTEGNR